tara:strand:+ start:4511 stop:4738 length:228 start_codon:yes stop_codon:yes gene_type:complete
VKKLEKQILEIFKKNLKNKNVKKNSTTQDIIEWDSLNHVNIINETSKKFSIKISFYEMVNINSVKKLIDLVKKKL